jgi:hypothetical protein
MLSNDNNQEFSLSNDQVVKFTYLSCCLSSAYCVEALLNLSR